MPAKPKPVDRPGTAASPGSGAPTTERAKTTKTAKRKAKRIPRTAKMAPARVERPFPLVTLAAAIRVPTGIKEKNSGNPYLSEDVAKAVGMGAKGGAFFYLTAGARDYGLTTGTRDTERIALTDLGRSLVYPANPTEAIEANLKAFLNIDLFRRVLEHYKGSSLPEMEYLSNTLAKEFGLAPEVHEQFVNVFRKNCEFLDIRDWPTDSSMSSERGLETQAAAGPAVVTLGQSKRQTGLLCFVIMPFIERQEGHSSGFFEEVLRSLIVPAATEAGFTVRSARRQGSDVIQQTIVSDLLQADLVVADLTEHNPNVMFELGMRMAHDKPIALIRARGTGGIFDVDNMLRVYDYDPNLWPSTIAKDLPALKDHVAATWDNRDSDITYMKLLGRPIAR